jgi:hypothetical protein
MATLAGVSKTPDFDTMLRQYFRGSVFTHYFIGQTPNRQTQKCRIPYFIHVLAGRPQC